MGRNALRMLAFLFSPVEQAIWVVLVLLIGFPVVLYLHSLRVAIDFVFECADRGHP